MRVTRIIPSAVVAAVLCFSSIGTARAADGANIRQVVRQLVAFFQGDGYLRYNEAISLNFVEEDVVNAYASYDSGHVSVNFFKKLLEDMTPDEVTIVVCHELGHLLGDMPISKIGFTPASAIRQSPLSVEGEADYFAGKCAVAYFMEMEGFDLGGAQEKTFFAAAGVFSKLYEVEALGQNAERDRFQGVNTTYPDPSCRTLSVWNGAEEKPRPTCWYNPGRP